MVHASIAAVSLLALGLLAPPKAFSQIRCDILRTSARGYAGRCVSDSRAILALVLQSPPSGTMGRWHGTQVRIFGERGDSTRDIVDWTAFGPAFVDIGDQDSLFSYCWCKVTVATLDTNGLHFEADPERTGPATQSDLQVLTRVRTYFSDSTRWNRHSDRTRGVAYCPREAPSRTLYCALQEADLAVRGAFYLFTPATAAIREAITAASTRRYQHPLDGFNNDPLLTFEAFRRSLADAERRVREALAGTRSGA